MLGVLVSFKKKRKKKRGSLEPDTEVLDVNKRRLSAGNLRWLRVRSGKSQARGRGIQPLRAPVELQEGGEKCQKGLKRTSWSYLIAVFDRSSTISTRLTCPSVLHFIKHAVNIN